MIWLQSSTIITHFMTTRATSTINSEETITTYGIHDTVMNDYPYCCWRSNDKCLFWHCRANIERPDAINKKFMMQLYPDYIRGTLVIVLQEAISNYCLPNVAPCGNLYYRNRMSLVNSDIDDRKVWFQFYCISVAIPVHIPPRCCHQCVCRCYTT